MQGPFLRKYGVQTTVDFQLFEVDGVDFRVDAAHVAGDSTIMKDEGAEGNTDNGFTDEGQGYSLVLTATEMEAARIVVYLVDQTATKVWLDMALVIETYGNASAMHAFDLDVATQDVNVASMDAGTVTAAAVATDAIDADAIAANAIGASELATDAIGAAQLATDAIGAAEIAANAITSSELATSAVEEIRDAVTGGAYSMDTDANGRIRIVDGVGAGELDTDAGTVLLRAATETQIDAIETDTNSLNDTKVPDIISLANINGEVDTALTDYDGPTNAEMEARTLVAASYFDPAADTVATVTDVTNQVTADVTAISGDAPAAVNLEADYDGTGYNKAASTINTAANLTTNNDKTGYGLANGAITAAVVATDAIDADAIANNAIDAAAIAADAITAAKIATDAITSDELATSAVEEIRDAVTGGAYALDTDANGRMRIVDGVGAGELDTDAGTVLLRAATETQIDAIETDTNSLNDTKVPDIISLANINGEVDTALTDIKLDHLIAVADADDPVDDSIVAKLAASDGDWSGFDEATDSLEAIRDRGDAAWTTGAGTGLSPLASGTAQAGAAGSITLAAGESATNDLYNGARVLLTGGTGAGQARIITDYDGGTKVASTAPNWTTNPDVTSTYEIQASDAAVGWWRGAQVNVLTSGRLDTDVGAIENADPTDTIRDAVVDDATRIDGSAMNALSALTPGNTLADVDDIAGLNDVSTAQVRTQVDDGLTAYDGPTNAEMEARTLVAADYFDPAADTVANVTTVATLTGQTPQTGDNYARLGAPAGASVSADIAAVKADTGNIETDTQDIQTRLPAALVGGRMDSDAVAISGSTAAADAVEANIGNLDQAISSLNDLSAAQVNAEVDAALVDIKLDHLVAVADADDPVDDSIVAKLAASDGDWSGFDNTADSQEAIRDRGDAAWTTGAGTGLSPLASGTAQAGAAGSITLAAGATATDDLYNGARVLITGGTGAGQARIITDYDGGTKVASTAPDWETNPDNTSTYEIQAADANLGAVRGTALTETNAGDLAENISVFYDVDPPTTNTVDDVGGGSGATAAQVWSYGTRTLTAFGPPGLVEYTYEVTDDVTLLPIEGARVWVTTDIAGTNTIWSGTTDILGIARDANGAKPNLDPGTYYFWTNKTGYVFDNPDTEVVV